jgi:hypothetical protein
MTLEKKLEEVGAECIVKFPGKYTCIPGKRNPDVAGRRHPYYY